MTGVSRQKSVIQRVLEFGGAPQELWHTVADEYELGGRIPAQRAELWIRCLDTCLSKGGQCTEFSECAKRIPIQGGSKGLRRRADHFGNQAPAITASAGQINALLKSYDLLDRIEVRALSPRERDTLARIAIKNADYARGLVENRIDEFSTLSDVLLHIRTLMHYGVDEWKRLFYHKGILSMRRGYVVGAISILKHAAFTVSELSHPRTPLRLKVVRDVPWHKLPPDVFDALKSRYVRMLRNIHEDFDDMARSVTVDIMLGDNRIIDVTRVSPGRTAFDTVPMKMGPFQFVVGQVQTYKLLAVALEKGARGVEVALHGNNLFDRRWASGVLEVASRVGLEFAVTHTGISSDKSVKVFGDMSISEGRVRLDGIPPLPELHSKNEVKVAAPVIDPPTSAREEAKPKGPSVDPNISYRDFLIQSTKRGGAHARWAQRVRQVMGDEESPLYYAINAPLDAPAISVVTKLYEAVKRMIDGLFSSFEELLEDVTRIEKSDLSMDYVSAFTSRQAINTELQLVRDAERLIEGAEQRYQELYKWWDFAEQIGDFVLPSDRGDVVADLQEKVQSRFLNEFITLEERVLTLGLQLEERRNVLDEKARILNVSDPAGREKNSQDVVRGRIDSIEKGLARAKSRVKNIVDGFSAFDTSTAEERCIFFDELPQAVASLNGERFRMPDEDESALMAQIREDIEEFNRQVDASIKTLINQGRTLEKAIRVPHEIGLASSSNSSIQNLELRDDITVDVPTDRKGVDEEAIEMLRHEFTKSRALVVEKFGGNEITRETFLVGKGELMKIMAWKEGGRTRPVGGIDLMGNAYHLGRDFWGAQLVKTRELDPTHVLSRIASAVDAVLKQGNYAAVDLVTTLIDNVGKRGARVMWQRVLSDLLHNRIDDAGDAFWSNRVRSVMLGLYHDISKVDWLKEKSRRWYRLRSKYSPRFSDIKPVLSNESIEIGKMSRQQMIKAVEHSGLLPRSSEVREKMLDRMRESRRAILQEHAEGDLSGASMMADYFDAILMQMGGDAAEIMAERMADVLGWMTERGDIADELMTDRAYFKMIVKHEEAMAYAIAEDGAEQDVWKIQRMDENKVMRRLYNHRRLKRIGKEKMGQLVDLSKSRWSGTGYPVLSHEMPEAAHLISGLLIGDEDGQLLRHLACKMINLWESRLSRSNDLRNEMARASYGFYLNVHHFMKQPPWDGNVHESPKYHRGKKFAVRGKNFDRPDSEAIHELVGKLLNCGSVIPPAGNSGLGFQIGNLFVNNVLFS